MDELNQDQIQQLHQLGINIPIESKIAVSKKSFPIFPLLSISGLTLLSFSGLILFKNKSSTISSPVTTTPQSAPTPTQVPKSIQHYLLSSQQFFSQAIQDQSQKNNDSAIQNLNQSILAATAAIKEFPSDYRGYFQRARIYQSVLSSNPKLSSQIISDLANAQKLEPQNADITRSLASIYAQTGDAQNTINYLSQTITLDPTQAQNFYDLAKVQQQTGLLPQALETYTRLISLVSDPTQKTQIESEKSALEKLISQNPNSKTSSPTINPLPTISTSPTNLDSPTIQASIDSNLIIAAPESINKVEVSSLTNSNALSGTGTLSSGQKEITITNSNLSSASQIYVTAVSGGKNQNLQVLSKSADSFVVGLDTAISEDIQFKWWIINK